MRTQSHRKARQEQGPDHREVEREAEVESTSMSLFGDMNRGDFSAKRASMERFAEQVANDVLPEDEGSGEERGMDFISIITIVISILQTVVQQCPAPLAQIRQRVRRPGPAQRAAILKQTQSTCSCMGMGKHAGAIYRSLTARGPSLPEPDLDSIIEVAQDDTNLLI